MSVIPLDVSGPHVRYIEEAAFLFGMTRKVENYVSKFRTNISSGRAHRAEPQLFGGP